MISFTKNTLLLLVDLQKAIDHPSWGERNNIDAEIQVSRLLEIWREKDMPIIHVQHMSTNPNSYYRPGQMYNEFKEISKPLEDEIVIQKKTNSAFIGTDLLERLNDGNIKDIVITGVITNNSIEATARMSGNLGFNSCVVSDATYTFGKADFSGKWRTAQEVHDMSLVNLSGEYADILNSDEVMGFVSVIS